MFITEERKELFKAVSQAQGEFSTVEKNGTNPHFNSKFAPLDSIIEMIRPILTKYGLAVMQHCDIPDGPGIIIETMISHESGQYLTNRLFTPVVKNDPQGYGSAITYARRYALGATLGIVSDEDVDGNQSAAKATTKTATQAAKSAHVPGTISAEQNKLLRTMLTTNQIDPAVFKSHFGIASSTDIKATMMDKCVEWINEEIKMKEESK